MKKAEAEFETGNGVWLIEDRKAAQKTVYSAEISLKEGKASVAYYLLDEKGIQDFNKIEEKHLYISREELIKSL